MTDDTESAATSIRSEGWNRQAWEQAMRSAVEHDLRQELAQSLPGATLYEARLIGEYPLTQIAVLFGFDWRPDCKFGYSWGAFWEDVEADVVSRRADRWSDIEPDGWSAFPVVLTNFVEAVRQPPVDCEQGAVTWYSEKSLSLEEAARRAHFRLVRATWLPPRTRLSLVTYVRATAATPERIEVLYSTKDHIDTVITVSGYPLPMSGAWVPVTANGDLLLERSTEDGFWRAHLRRTDSYVLINSPLEDETELLSSVVEISSRQPDVVEGYAAMPSCVR